MSRRKILWTPSTSCVGPASTSMKNASIGHEVEVFAKDHTYAIVNTPTGNSSRKLFAQTAPLASALGLQRITCLNPASYVTLVDE